jgi:FKBP-type peptidyl-prolyl cis-trans isomerase 2
MAQIKKGDFVEVDYVGKVKEGGIVFDTTKEDVAKKNNIHNKDAHYKPIIVCVGENQLLKGIDEALEGKTQGKHAFTVPPEKGFGKKSAKLLQLISTSKFREQNITPLPGLQVNIDGIMGVVKTVTGGRVIVDFNHPLAGKTLEYEVEIKRVVTDEKEKVDALLNLVNLKDFETRIVNDAAEITIKSEIPKEVQQKIGEEIKRLTSVKSVEFKTARPEEKTQKEKVLAEKKAEKEIKKNAEAKKPVQNTENKENL